MSIRHATNDTLFLVTPEIDAALMDQLRGGDKQAAALMTQALYPELKRMAVARMNGEKDGHTWQASDLVNELYVELAKSRQLKLRDDNGEARSAFLGLASHIMRRLLCGHARRLYRRVTKTPVDEEILVENGPEALNRIDRVMSKLEALNPRLRAVVELRVFEGLSGDEISARLGCSRRTVNRDWIFAKNLIAKELG